jgi:hypothetical protein
MDLMEDVMVDLMVGFDVSSASVRNKLDGLVGFVEKLGFDFF